MRNNSSDQTREKLYEEYEESFFKLIVYDAAGKEGKLLLEENEKLKEDPEFSPSPEATQKFKKQLSFHLKECKTHEKKRHVTVVLKRTAMAMSAVVVLFTTMMFSVEAFRVKVLNLWLDIQPEYTSFQLKDNNGDSDTDRSAVNWTDAFVPTYVPEGYTATDISSNELSKRILFENEKKNLTIIYMELGSSSNLAVDTENASVMKTVKINGHDGTLIVKEPMVSVVWDMNNAMFLIQGQESVDETLKMAEGVKFVNK